MTDARVHGAAVEALGVGTPSAAVHGAALEAMGAVPADVRTHGVVVEFLGVYIGPPNVPENVAGVPGVFTADLSWDPPSSGYPVEFYQVRADGGPWTYVGLAESYHFTGLTADADHTLEVRALNAGGASDPVAALVHTFASGETPPGYYRAVVTLGAHVFTDAEIVLPLTLGWAIPDDVDYFPTQADLTTLQFGIVVDDVTELADVVRGTTCTFRMFVQVDDEADPWQTFDGVVTQLKARRLDFEETGRTLLTVFASDDNMRLADKTVGYANDWPEENVFNRVERICSESVITPDWFNINGGLEGTLPARDKSPISVLAALREALKDVASDNISEPPAEYYGRYVFHYHLEATDFIDANTLRIQPFERRVYETGVLDGGLIEADGEWDKLPNRPAPTWGFVDEAAFGANDGTPPFVRSTSFVDTSPVNWSAVSRDNLGEALLSDDSTNLDGWYAREVRYRMLGDDHNEDVPGDDHLADILLVTMWASFAPILYCLPVVLDNVAARYRLNGETYLAGTLTGARLIIPPGGRFYVTLRLRPELLPGTDLP